MCNILRSLHRNINLTDFICDIRAMQTYCGTNTVHPRDLFCLPESIPDGKQFQLRYRVYDKYDYCAIEDILYSAEVTERRVRWQDDHER